jgi:hypothetical protein
MPIVVKGVNAKAFQVWYDNVWFWFVQDK